MLPAPGVRSRDANVAPLMDIYRAVNLTMVFPLMVTFVQEQQDYVFFEGYDHFGRLFVEALLLVPCMYLKVSLLGDSQWTISLRLLRRHVSQLA